MIELIVLPASFAMLFPRSVLQQKCYSCHLSFLLQMERRHTHAAQRCEIYFTNNLPDRKSETSFQFEAQFISNISTDSNGRY